MSALVPSAVQGRGTDLSLSALCRAPYELRGHVADRQDRIRQARAHDATRHFPHGAGRFVLNDDAAARACYLLASLKGVFAHAGQHEAERIRAVDIGCGSKQDVRRRPARVLEWTVAER